MDRPCWGQLGLSTPIRESCRGWHLCSVHYLVCFAKADTLASMKSGEKALYSADMYFLIQRQLENLLFSRANALSKSSASVELAYHDSELHELNVMPSSSVKHILGNDILDAESSCDVKPAFHFAGTVSLGQPPPKSQTNAAFVIGLRPC